MPQTQEISSVCLAACARIYPTVAFFFPLPNANMGLILILRVLKSGISSLGYPTDGGEDEEEEERSSALRDKKGSHKVATLEEWGRGFRWD